MKGNARMYFLYKLYGGGSLLNLSIYDFEDSLLEDSETQ